MSEPVIGLRDRTGASNDPEEVATNLSMPSARWMTSAAAVSGPSPRRTHPEGSGPDA